MSASSALALTISTGFDGVTINQSNLTTTTGLNQWNDLVRWQINPSGGNPGAWAQQTNSGVGPETSLLFYGFDATAIAQGTPFALNFDFINQGNSSFTGLAFLGGLNGTQSISQFAPWPDLSTTTFFSSPLLNNTADWTHVSLSGTVAGVYETIYMAFEMGGSEYLRGIDNVNLTIGDAAPVPEPSSILLIGLGIFGVHIWSRRRVRG